MRIPSTKVPVVAQEMVRALLDRGYVETSDPAEVRLDVEAVLQQYLRDEQAVTDRARDLLAARNLPPTELGRLRKLVADERKLKLGDEAIDYVLDQLLEMLMHSQAVEEIFAEDHVLRLCLREPLRKVASLEEELQAEVRGQLKHVKEGTALWEVEYQRMMEDVKRRRGL